MNISNRELAIGLPCSFPTVPTSFFYSYSLMEKPSYTLIHADNGPIDTLRNDLVSKALEARMTHLIMLDVDMIYHPKTIMQLLSHQLPIVGALCYRRYPPFDSIMLRANDDGSIFDVIEDEEWEEGDLVEVDATGSGCIMYNMEVFKRMPSPWFKFTKYPDTGQPLGEDIGFCLELRKAGYKIFVDTSIPCDHLTTMAVNRNTHLLYKSMKNKQSKAALERALDTNVVNL
jgi:hypothetical protein